MDSEIKLSPNEKSFYDKVVERISQANPSCEKSFPLSEITNLLKKSGLPKDKLATIWNKMNFKEKKATTSHIYKCLKYISIFQNGLECDMNSICPLPNLETRNSSQ